MADKFVNISDNELKDWLLKITESDKTFTTMSTDTGVHRHKISSTLKLKRCKKDEYNILKTYFDNGMPDKKTSSKKKVKAA